MILCIKCSPEIKDKMDSILHNGQYKDYSELIAIAISNLWVLEQEVTRKGHFMIAKDGTLSSAPGPESKPERGKTTSARKQALHPRSQGMAIPSEHSSVDQPPRIPDIFLLHERDNLHISTLEPQCDKLDAGKIFTLDRWLFGQYNKLLPAKASCRALAYMAPTYEKGIPLVVAGSEIARTASELGDWLSSRDYQNKVGRDDALSTAFPRSGPESEKGRVRYANQFVGSVNFHGQLSGLLSDYRLAALATADPPGLLLTTHGLAFAKLSNPVIDGMQGEMTCKFSSEESSFLMDLIRQFVPVEDFAFRTLLKAVLDGADTPDKLGEALLSLAPSDSNRSLSNSFLASQRSGALSRMADIGLITRVRQGVRVTYAITDLGRDYVQKM
jgi:hypothetical protein